MEPQLDDHSLQNNLLEATAHIHSTNKPKPVPFTWMAYASNLIAIFLLVLNYVNMKLGGLGLLAVLSYFMEGQNHFRAPLLLSVAFSVHIGVVILVLVVLYLMIGTKACKRSRSSPCSVGIMIILTLVLGAAYTMLLLTLSPYGDYDRVVWPWESLADIKNLNDENEYSEYGHDAVDAIISGIIVTLPALVFLCCILFGEFSRKQRNRPDMYDNVMAEEGLNLADDESAAPSAPMNYEEEMLQSAEHRPAASGSGKLPTSEHFLNKIMMWECGLALFQIYSTLVGAIFDIRHPYGDEDIPKYFEIIPVVGLIVILALVPFAMLPIICRRRGVWFNLVNVAGSMILQPIYIVQLIAPYVIGWSGQHHSPPAAVLGFMFSTSTSIALLVLCVVHIVIAYLTPDPYRRT